jgi:hypothetical protein
MLLLALTACSRGDLKAQAFYDAEGFQMAHRTGADTYEVTGSAFTVRGGNLIPMFDGELREDLGGKYFKTEGDRVNYYNQDEQIVGSYETTTKRYIHIEHGKEDYTAVLLDGAIYTDGSEPAFRLEGDFDPEFAGCILFFFLGY